MQCRESRDAIREDLNGKREELRRLMGDNTPQQEADILQQAIATAREAEQKVRTAYETGSGELRQLEGKRDNLLKSRLDSQQQQQEQQQRLDLMIARFNATHSPVQFTELDRIFTSQTDWKALRQHLDELKEQRVLTANNLDQARAELQALRAETNRPVMEKATTKVSGADAESGTTDGHEALPTLLRRTAPYTLLYARCSPPRAMPHK